jgi:HTH-type transcriptional regulator / antitoxin HipB
MEEILHDASDVGAFLRARRKSLGITQARVAALCGTGVRFISDLENGKPRVELCKVLDVASALGVDLYAKVRGSAV